MSQANELTGAAYFELAARGKNEWWRYIVVPPLAIVLAVTGFGVLSLALSLAHVPARELARELVQPSQPVVFYLGAAVLYGGVMAAFALAIRVIQSKSPRDIAGPFAPSLFLKGAAFWLLVQTGIAVIDFLIAPSGFSLTISRATTTLALVATVGLSIQTLAEEFVFRGYVTQGLLLATRRPLVASILSGLLFGSLHIPNGVPQFASATVFGVACSLIAIRTGSIAFTYGLHMANNYLGAVVLVSAGDVFRGSPGVFIQNTPGLMWSDVALNATALILFAIPPTVWRSLYPASAAQSKGDYLNGVINTQSIEPNHQIASDLHES